jgi:hypothetical protein
MSKTRSLQEIKEYCSWNNIPYTIIKQQDIVDWEELPDYIEEKISIDISKCIGGTKEGLMKYLRYE